MSLERYRDMRRFGETPEPAGGAPEPSAPPPLPRFVVQEHHASRLHYDFRLEIAGVLKSWAVPKGPCRDPEVKRLAMQTEDHPVEYLTFEGIIPQGNYGAGAMYVWDSGAFEARENDLLRGWEKGALHLELHGSRMQGAWRIYRVQAGERPQWLLQKAADEFAVPGDETEQIGQPDGSGIRAARMASGAQAVSLCEPRLAGQRPPCFRRLALEAPVERRPVVDTRRIVTVEEFMALEHPRGELALRLGHEVVGFTNLERPYWPSEGITKADLLRYYLRVAPSIMPFLEGRAAIQKRYPRGIEAPAFYQHDVESAPDFLRVVLLAHAEKPTRYAVYTTPASLLHLVTLGSIEQHPWQSRVDSLETPDWLLLDLDPFDAPWERLAACAQTARAALGVFGLEAYLKTSGSRGLHVYVPLAGATYQRTVEAAEAVCRFVAEQLPEIATVQRLVSGRVRGQVYMDWYQNGFGKSLASPYSVRARPGAPVSCPITWEELAAGARIEDFTIRTVPERLDAGADPWRGMMERGQRLPGG